MMYPSVPQAKLLSMEWKVLEEDTKAAYRQRVTRDSRDYQVAEDRKRVCALIYISVTLGGRPDIQKTFLCLNINISRLP